MPVLSSAANQDQLDEEHDLHKINDPLREFLVDRQKISDAKSDTSKNDVEIGGLAIGQIKGKAKKFLRQSVKNDAVGFDAIREEEEETVPSVAFKAAVTAPKVAKVSVRSSEPPNQPIESNETTPSSHTEAQSIEVESGHVEVPSPMPNNVVEFSAESNASSMYSCAPSPQVF